MENSTPVPTLTPIQKKLNVFNSVERKNEELKWPILNLKTSNYTHVLNSSNINH